jgi:hypothetical protein
MKKECKIEDIVIAYKNHPDILVSIIEEKKFGTKDRSRIKREKELMRCDLEILEEALREINKLMRREVIFKIAPFAII